MRIVAGDATYAADIAAIAKASWPDTYSSIISEEQINFMLDKFYALPVLTEQLNNPLHYFFMAMDNDQCIGYAHILPAAEEEGCYKLSKLYLYPSYKGKGIGKQLILHCETFCKQNSISALYLNVNRNNPAYHFYLNQGFDVMQEVDIPLDKFWLNDYVMRKRIL
jgi:diamine N-acetyltransferase